MYRTTLAAGRNFGYNSGHLENYPHLSEFDMNEQEIPRRNFAVAVCAAGIGAVAVGAPICAGVRATIYPTSQHGGEGKEYSVAHVDQLDTTPTKFPIIDDKRDAWMVTKNQQLGSVFVRKTTDGSVAAFQTVCPHAGCGIQAGHTTNPTAGEKEMLFFCPCHSAYFDLTGHRLDDVCPRDMDSLETKITPDGTVLVKFEQFQTGSAAKIRV